MLSGYVTNLAAFNVTDGSQPGGLVIAAKTLYGETSGGEPFGLMQGNGNVYSLPVTGGTPTVLASFNGTDGSDPTGPLILSGTTLYGITNGGGAHDAGEVFSLPISGGSPTVLASFDGVSEAAPTSLVLSGDTLFGITQGTISQGMTAIPGSVFSLPISGGSPDILHSFSASDETQPEPGLVVAGNTIYGQDGQQIFSLPISGGTPATLGLFGDAVQGEPDNLIFSGNTLYGTALLESTGAVIFSLPIAGGGPTIISSLQNNQTFRDVVLSGDTFYCSASIGTTSLDSANGKLFAVPLAGGVPTELDDLRINQYGEIPQDLLVSDGVLYGTATSSDFFDDNHGVVFALPLVPISSSISLTSTHVPVYQGQHVTLSATVTGLGPGGGAPTGTVTFFNDGTAIGTPQTLTNGTATFTTTTLPIGSDSITAAYGGDADYASASTASAFIATVRKVPTGSIPTITSATNSASTHGYTIAASVVATDTGPAGAAGLKYYWSAIHLPAGATMPTFNINGTNAAQNIIARFSKAGGYILQCEVKNAAGNDVTTDVLVTVSQKATSLKIEPHAAHIAKDATLQYTATVLDQFGHPMRTPQTLTYLVAAGPGSISSSGLFSATPIAGPVTIELESDDLTAAVGAVVG